MPKQVAKKDFETSSSTKVGSPQVGDQFECGKCGMQIEITKDCRCEDPEHVRFECCGQAMLQV